jgi:hypothetical protein
MKYVYLIQSLEDGYYKIGISKNPFSRRKQLKTGNASPSKLIEEYKAEYPKLIETAMHNRYSHLRKEGEWFALSIENEVTFMDECKKIEESIIFLKQNNNIFI